MRKKKDIFKFKSVELVKGCTPLNEILDFGQLHNFRGQVKLKNFLSSFCIRGPLSILRMELGVCTQGRLTPVELLGEYIRYEQLKEVWQACCYNVEYEVFVWLYDKFSNLSIFVLAKVEPFSSLRFVFCYFWQLHGYLGFMQIIWNFFN